MLCSSSACGAVLLEHCSCCLHDVFLVLMVSALLLLHLYLSCQGEVTELQTLAAVQHHLWEVKDYKKKNFFSNWH